MNAMHNIDITIRLSVHPLPLPTIHPRLLFFGFGLVRLFLVVNYGSHRTSLHYRVLTSLDVGEDQICTRFVTETELNEDFYSKYFKLVSLLLSLTVHSVSKNAPTLKRRYSSNGNDRFRWHFAKEKTLPRILLL